MFAKICFQEQGINLRAYQKNLVFLMILGVYGLTCLALYISWTGVGETNIAGIQGRYFIAWVPIMMLALRTNKFSAEAIYGKKLFFYFSIVETLYFFDFLKIFFVI